MDKPPKKPRVRLNTKPARIETAKDGRSPKVEFWEVLHTRTSTFESVIPLTEIAKRLVSSGSCILAFGNDGRYWHLRDGDVCEDLLTVDSRPRAKHGTVHFERVDDELALRCLLLATELGFIESQTFSEEVLTNVEYIRCFFEPFLVEESGRHTSLYPYAKIYKNGVCTISLRIFAGEVLKTLDQVADEFLGLGSRYLDNLLIPKSVYQSAPVDDIVTAFLELNLSSAIQHGPEELAKALVGEAIKLEEANQERVYVRTRFEEVSGFGMLDLVWAVLEGLLDDVAFRPVKLSIPALASRRSAYSRPWFGHPLFFLIKWEGQPNEASKLDGFEPEVARLIAGSPNVAESAIPYLVRPLPRVFDDYRAYMTQGASVYALSKACLDRAESEDTHFQRVSFPMIANEELALWLVGSYHAVERKAQSARSYSELSGSKRDLLLLESLTNRLTHYGELEDLFQDYLGRFGIPKTIQRVQSSLSQLDQDLKDRQNLRIASLGLIVSILFGVVGSGQLSEVIFKPLRKAGVHIPTLFGLPQATSDFLLSALILFGISLSSWLALTASTRRKRK
jgi:hypothetical protein